KRKFQDDIINKEQEIEILRNGATELEKEVESLREGQILSIPSQEGNRHIDELLGKLPSHLSICVRNYLKNSSGTQKGYRFDKELKTPALSVNFLSPVANRYLKSILIGHLGEVLNNSFKVGRETLAAVLVA
ncbi:unnamed protein product, partial [Ceratitis capitata]